MKKQMRKKIIQLWKYSKTHQIIDNIISSGFRKRLNVYYDENVPLFRKNGYRKSGTMILRVRSRDTALN